MTKHIYNILSVLGLSAILMTGCKKDDKITYHEKPAVYFFTDSLMFYYSDSTTYSFAIHASDLQQDTVKIPIKITGLAADKDRAVNVEAIPDSTTAVAGKHYTILPAVIKAGAYTDSVRILVKKTPELDNTEVRLDLQISASADLQPGVKERKHYLIKINNVLTKPANWENLLVLFFGSYSEVKYRFIIDVTGVSVFDAKTATGGVDFQYYQFLKQLVRDALSTYEQQNGALLDENGNPVTFPS